ncbi:MAG: hypothetical protein GY754_35375 [bacterium]|nr:hypothetical protein [bacterium]
MRIIAFLLFISGIIWASIFAAAAEPLWEFFIPGAVAAAAGALILRFKKQDHSPLSGELFETGETGEKKTSSIVFDMRQKVSLAIEFFSGDQPRPRDAKQTIEEILSSIQSILDQSEKDPDFYIFLAGVERSLNRAWSSLVDNYPHEAEKSLVHARELLSKSF